MLGYQRDMFMGLSWDYECTRAGLMSELTRHWTDGNYYSAVTQVNRLVEKLEKRIRNMAPKAEAKPPKEKFYWVNCPVTEEDIPNIEALFPTVESALDLLGAAIAEGLKVSFALNPKNDLTICSLSDRREESATFGACLTGGADGWSEALCVMLYKYTALLQGDLSEGQETAGTKRRIM